MQLTKWFATPQRILMISRKVWALGARCFSSMATTQKSHTVIVPLPVPYLQEDRISVFGRPLALSQNRPHAKPPLAFKRGRQRKLRLKYSDFSSSRVSQYAANGVTHARYNLACKLCITQGQLCWRTRSVWQPTTRQSLLHRTTHTCLCQE